jgi:hypothetical protein
MIKDSHSFLLVKFSFMFYVVFHNDPSIFQQMIISWLNFEKPT